MSETASPQAPFGAALRTAAADGASVRAIAAALGGRGHGVLALLLGLILLIPVKWVLPQLAGLLLLASGWRLFAAKAAPSPLIGNRILAKPGVERAASAIDKQRWLSAILHPRLPDFVSGATVYAAAIALILAGLAALLPTTHYFLGLALIVLGLGLAQMDGAATLAGLAACFAASFYVLTMTAGAAAGAPFAGPWAEGALPWLADWLKPAALFPDDHSAR
jgi:hypothetical protein